MAAFLSRCRFSEHNLFLTQNNNPTLFSLSVGLLLLPGVKALSPLEADGLQKIPFVCSCSIELNIHSPKRQK